MRKFFKKLLLLTLIFAVALGFCGLFGNSMKTSAAEASEKDTNLNLTKLAEDFEFITKFYVLDDTLTGDNTVTEHDFVLSNDIINCNHVYEPHLSASDYTTEFTGFYTFMDDNSIAVTVKAGVDIIEFCGYSMSYFDLTKTQYDENGNALYVGTEATGAGTLSAEGAQFSYFAYVGKSDVDRTIVIKSSDFIEPFIFNVINTYASSTLTVTEIAQYQQTGTRFYCFAPTLSKTVCKDGLVTSLHLNGEGIDGVSSCSAVYPTFGTMWGYYNGIYDAFFGNVRKLDFTGNDRDYPSDITDSAIRKQINTAHKEAYGEYYDYVANSKTLNTEVDYNANNLPFVGGYQYSDTRVNEFLKLYCTDATGKIFNYVDESNLDRIISGNEAYSTFSAGQKDFINQLIANANGSQSRFKTYEDLLLYAKGLKEANRFIEVYIECKDGENVKVISVDEDNLGNAVEDYNKYPELYQEIITEKLTEMNNGLEKTFEEVVKQATNEKTDSMISGEGKGNGKGSGDYNLDFGNFSFKNFFDNLGRLFEDPAKFFEELGEALTNEKDAVKNWLYLIVKIVIAVVVGVLIFKGIKALVDLIRG